jgi:hypothetical protein
MWDMRRYIVWVRRTRGIALTELIRRATAATYFIAGAIVFMIECEKVEAGRLMMRRKLLNNGTSYRWRSCDVDLRSALVALSLAHHLYAVEL